MNGEGRVVTDDGLDFNQLATAEEWLQIAVAAAVVTRMRPNYQLFCDVTAYEGAAVFTNLLALVWEYAEGTNSAIDFDKQQQKLEAITPNPADYDMYGVWPALDATVAMASLLSCCERFDVAEIEAVMDVSRTTISGFLEASGEEVAGHALFAIEDDYVEAVLAAASLSGSRKPCVAAIRAIARESDVSNIGLGLD